MSEQLENAAASEIPNQHAAVETTKDGVVIKATDNGGEITLPGGEKMSYSRTKESGYLRDKLKLLEKSLRNDPCLPTQVLFKNQDQAALDLTERYIKGVASIVKVIEKYGSGVDMASYSFRLPHLMNIGDWLNIVSRLQFATSLKSIADTLNENLSKDAIHKWDVLSLKDDGQYYIGDTDIRKGELVDVFTISEKVLSKVVFSDHGVVNCKTIEEHSIPMFHYTKDQILNMSSEDLEKRAHNLTPEGEHLLGTDAWSFIDGLLYRISGHDEEEVIEVSTDILSRIDLDPAIKLKDYMTLGTMLNEQDLPYGLNISLLASMRDYYCKNASVFYGFKEQVENFYKYPDVFRSKLNSDPFAKTLPPNALVITGIPDIARLLDKNSKVLRLRLVKFDGTIVNAVTVTREIVMAKFGSFARYNSTPIFFQGIEFTDKPAKSNVIKQMVDKMSGKVPFTQNKDNFVLTDELITSDQILGFINFDTKAYYFGDDSDPAVDDKLAMYHTLSKKFKRLAKGAE